TELLEKLLGPYGLDEVQLKPDLTGALLVLLGSIRGNRNQPRPRSRRIVPQGRGELVTVGIRQTDVAENDVRRHLLRGFHALPAGVGHRDGVSAKLQQLAQGLRRVMVVFDDENAQVLRGLERRQLRPRRRAVPQGLQATTQIAEGVVDLEFERADALERARLHADMAVFTEEAARQALYVAYQHTRFRVVHHVDSARAQLRQPAQAFRVSAGAGVTDHEPHERRVQAERFFQVSLGHRCFAPPAGTPGSVMLLGIRDAPVTENSIAMSPDCYRPAVLPQTRFANSG